MKPVIYAAIFCAAMITTPVVAATIDFSTVAPGTAITNQFSGLSFTLSGNDRSGNPTVNNLFGVQVALMNSNSTYASSFYPSAFLMTIDFATLASDLSFTFHNFGTEGLPGGSTYTALNSLGAVISSGSLEDIQGYSLITVAGSDIARLAISNGDRTEWTFGIGQLTYTLAPAGAVPEPAAWAMFIAGFGAVGTALRRSRKVNTAVSFA